jgi:hypothetical protein
MVLLQWESSEIVRTGPKKHEAPGPEAQGRANAEV